MNRQRHPAPGLVASTSSADQRHAGRDEEGRKGHRVSLVAIRSGTDWAPRVHEQSQNPCSEANADERT
jgi:hypothetical protein